MSERLPEDTILYKCDLENDYNFKWIAQILIVSLLML